MAKCVKCGKRGKGTFCTYCGTKYPTRLTKEQGSHQIFDHVTPKVKKIGLVIGVAILAVAVTFAIFVGSGALAKETKLSLQVLGEGCTREISYTLQAVDAAQHPLANKELALMIDGALLERLNTDNNGKIQSHVTIPSSACGKNATIEAKFDGDALHKATSVTTYVDARRPTLITAELPSKIEIGSHTPIKLALSDDSTKTPIGGVELDVTIADETRKHIAGSGDFDTVFPDETSKKLVVRYFGNNEFLPAVYSREDLTLVVPRCSDGTAVGACSDQIGYYCIEGKHITFDCTKCGCPSGKICSQNKCLTNEERAIETIRRLEQSIVKISTSLASGSGVILKHESGKTVVLTNRHVIDSADSVNDILVIDNSRMQHTPTAARIAPSALDLAIVYVDSIFGSPVTTADSSEINKGSKVVALGSPLGIQGSVSQGIISNILSDTTDSGATYTAIQTDAAINHGNSGGGLFLESSGRLVGINTFGYDDAEGLKFAISIQELTSRPISSWGTFVPVPRCDDGTPYGQCSDENIGYFCANNGYYVGACQTCGCPAQYPYCPENGECFGCPPGTTPYQNSDGEGVCV